MPGPEEAAQLLRDGNNPYKIAELMGVKYATVITYLYGQLGAGSLRKFEIMFSFKKEGRDLIEEAIYELNTDQPQVIFNNIRQKGFKVPYELIDLYLNFRSGLFGEMYELITQIELRFHFGVKKFLMKKYGKDEDGWWRKGIPETVRKKCAALRESDTNPATEPFSYTNLIDISNIITKDWISFDETLHGIFGKQKKKFEKSFKRLNDIRNSIMHPVKGLLVTKDDCIFVNEFLSKLGPGSNYFN